MLYVTHGAVGGEFCFSEYALYSNRQRTDWPLQKGQPSAYAFRLGLRGLFRENSYSAKISVNTWFQGDIGTIVSPLSCCLLKAQTLAVRLSRLDLRDVRPKECAS